MTPHPQDRYRLDTKTVTVTRVTQSHVEWEFRDSTLPNFTAKHFESVRNFLRLARKSLERGAVFEPAEQLHHERTNQPQ